MLSFDGQNLPAAEALIPLYEKAKDVKRLAEVLLVELEHTTDPAERHGAHAAARRAARPGRGRQARRAAHRAAGARRGTRPTSWAIETSRRLAAESGGWAELVEAYEAAVPRAEPSDETALLALLGDAGRRVRVASSANPELAIARNQTDPRARAQEPRGGRRRSSASTSRPGASPICSPIYDKKLELAKSKAEELEIRFKLAGLYEEEIKQPDKAIAALSGDPQAGSRAAAGAGGARSHLPAARPLEGAGGDDRRKEIDLSTDMAAVAELKFRRGAVLEQHLDDGAGAVASYREALELEPSHVGARTALQAYLSSADAELQQAAVEVLEPIYEATNDLAAPGRGAAHQASATRRRPTSASTLLLRIGKLEGQLGNADQAWEAYTRAFAESPASAAAREALENLANILDNWQPLVALYEKALSAKGKEKLPSALERELLLVVAVAYDEKLGQSTNARSSTSAARRASSPRTPRRWWRWSGSTRAPSAGAIWSTRCSRRRSWSPTPPSARRSAIRIATVWEEMLGNAEQAIVAWNVVLQDNPAQRAGAARARSPVPGARRVPRAGRQPAAAAEAGRGRRRRDGRAARAPGRAARAAARAAGRRGRHLLEDPASSSRSTARRSRRWSGSCPSPEHELDVAQLLEPIYKIRGDWPRLIGVYEVEARHAVDPEQKIALYKPDRRRLRDRPRRSGARLRGAGPRAGRGSAEPRGADERSSGWPARCGKLDDLVAPLRRGWSAGVADPERKNALYHKIARLCRGRPGRRRAGGGRLRARRWTSGRAISTRPTRSSSSTCARGDYANLVQLLLRKAEIVDGAAEKKALYFRAAQLYEEVLEDLESAVERLPARAVRRRRATGRRSISWSGSTSASGAGTISRTSTPRRRSWRRRPPRRSRCCSCSVRSTTASSAIRSARSRPTARSSTSIRRTTTPRRRSIACISSSERWYDLLAVLERQTELAPSPAEVVSLRFRIGELWREHLKDLARAVEAYRQVLAMDPGARADGARAGSADAAARTSRCWRPQVLEPIYESAGEWDRVIAVYEVMQAHSRGRAPARSSCCARIAEIEERRLSHQNAAFDVYGRALRVDPTNQDVLAHLDRLAARDRALGQAGDAARDRAGEGRRAAPRRSICCCASRASTRRRPASSRRRSPPTARAVDGRCRQQARRSSRSIACTGAPSSGTSWPTIVAPRDPASRRPTSDRVALTFRLAQIYELALVDMPKAVEAYREILNADPTHAETRAALERMFMGGTMQLEIADVLEPLYRTGEEWEKLHQISRGAARSADRRRRAAGAAAPPGRDRRAQAGRSGRGLRLVGRGGQGGSVVGAGARRAAAAGARDAPVGRLRHHHVRARRRPIVRRRSGATCCCVWPPASRTISATWSAPRRRSCRCSTSTRRTRRRSASLDRIYESQGMYENLAGDSAPAARHHRRQRRAGHPEPAPRPGLRRGAGGGRSGDRQLPGGAGARVAARARRWTPSSGSTSAASAGRSCTASTRSSSTSPASTSPARRHTHARLADRLNAPAAPSF